KCVCEEGATVVIDVHAARAHLGSEIAALPADRKLDIMHEITLFFDESPDGTLAAWSMGLRKFGRPDVVLLGVPPDAASDAALGMRDIAATLADGERIEPGDQIAGPDGRVLVAARFEAPLSAVVAVDGPAIVFAELPPDAERAAGAGEASDPG